MTRSRLRLYNRVRSPPSPLTRRSEPPGSYRPFRRRYRPRMGTLMSGFEATGVGTNPLGQRKHATALTGG